ncbi:hypothetical protein T484DRAFT_1798488 [Baffinella frigidus]|nr:hypothetical protein T484DRAFT_1798488 [Cryptophyta sp. CCMP2293]
MEEENAQALVVSTTPTAPATMAGSGSTLLARIYPIAAASTSTPWLRASLLPGMMLASSNLAPRPVQRRPATAAAHGSRVAAPHPPGRSAPAALPAAAPSMRGWHSEAPCQVHATAVRLISAPRGVSATLDVTGRSAHGARSARQDRRGISVGEMDRRDGESAGAMRLPPGQRVRAS